MEILEAFEASNKFVQHVNERTTLRAEARLTARMVELEARLTNNIIGQVSVLLTRMEERLSRR